MIITAMPISVEEAQEHEIDCDVIDHATFFAAEQSDDTSYKCVMIPEYSVILKPAEDMAAPLFLCKLHFNAFKISLRGASISVDEDFFD